MNVKRIIAAFAAVAAVAWPAAVFTGAGVAHADDYTYFPLKADYVGSPCTDECRFFPLSTGPFPMNQGDVRLVTDQLAISMPGGYHYPEVGQAVDCEQAGTPPSKQPSGGSGTDYRGDNNAFQWNASALLVAPADGEYYCVISVYVSDPDTGFTATVLSATPGQTTHGTWLEITPFSHPGAQQWPWSPPTPPKGVVPCQPGDKDKWVFDVNGNPIDTGTIATDANAGLTQCVYLGGRQSTSNIIFQNTWPDMNDAAAVRASTYATVVDFSVTGQNTVCWQYTGNCREDEDTVNGDSSTITSSLSIQQQYPDGSPCGAATVVYSENTVNGDSETDTAPTQTFDKHEGHLPVYYHATVPVSQLCGGSRTFATSLFTQLAGGDPIKFEDKHLIVVPIEEAQTTAVPNVTGPPPLTQAEAEAAIVAAQLNPVAPENDNYVTSTFPQGTVLATNSPVGTVEPVGSPVQLTVSAGLTTVPKVVGDIAKVAETAITDAGLMVTTSKITNCADQRKLGTVQSQSPPAFTQVSLGTSVSIEIIVCDR